MAIDKAALLKARSDQKDVEIPGVGTVRIRSLTRAEALALQGKETPVSEIEQKLLSAALVDPKLTEDEVRQWQEASPAGELEPIMEAILDLSGMAREAPKEAYQRFRG